MKTHTHCLKVWGLLTSDKLKASQFAGDRESIINRIIELERKPRTEFECACAKQRIATMIAQQTKV